MAIMAMAKVDKNFMMPKELERAIGRRYNGGQKGLVKLLAKMAKSMKTRT